MCKSILTTAGLGYFKRFGSSRESGIGYFRKHTTKERKLQFDCKMLLLNNYVPIPTQKLLFTRGELGMYVSFKKLFIERPPIRLVKQLAESHYLG